MPASLLTPLTLKGAIVSLGATTLPAVVVFQYNPETITRSLTPRRARRDDDNDCGGFEGNGFAGPPRETLQFTLALDAADGLDAADTIATTTGVATDLAALEMLITPSKVAALAAQALLRLSVITAVPDRPPLTLLFLGPARILPVRIDSLSVTEEAFDPNLNPIRASVAVAATVLGPDDVQDTGLPFLWALNYSAVVKEALAAVALAAAARDAGKGIANAVRRAT